MFILLSASPKGWGTSMSVTTDVVRPARLHPDFISPRYPLPAGLLGLILKQEQYYYLNLNEWDINF